MPDSLEDNVSCRICMDSKDNYVSLFSHDLSKKVMEIADVQVEKDDGLPDTICTECETDLEKCYEFRLKVQVSDKKFRDHITFSQVNIEECNIKEERYMDDGNSDNNDDREDSVTMDEGNCNDGSDDAQKNSEENEVTKPDPLNHVVVVEEKDSKVKMSEDPLLQEVMIEESQVKKIEETSVDPLVCMKEEAEIMDVDSNQPETFGPSSSVIRTELLRSFPILSSALSSEVISSENQFQLEKNHQQEVSTGWVETQHNVKSRQIPILPASSSPGGSNHDYFAVRQKQQSCSGFTLIPQPGFQLNSGILIPCVKITPKTYAFPQKCISYLDGIQSSGSVNVQNVTTHPLLTYESNVRPPAGDQNSHVIHLSNIPSAVSNSHRNSQHGTTHPVGTIEPQISDSTVSIESVSKLCEIKQKSATEVNIINTTVTESSEKFQSSSTTSEPNSEKDETKNEDEFFCKVCSVDCGSSDLLDEHKSGKDFMCRACTTSFSNHQDLEAHFYNHRKYTCQFCKKVFYIYKDLIHHKKTVLSCNKKPTKQTCKFCENRFVHEINLKIHIEQKHPEANLPEFTGTLFTCGICKRTFKKQGPFRYHLKSSHMVYENVECDICHKIVPGPERLKEHIKASHMQPSVGCPVCKKVFGNKHTLTSHMDSHYGKETVCDICGATVKGKIAFKYHMSRHQDRTYHCQICNETFNYRQKYKRHLEKKHNPQSTIRKSAICEICGKELKAKDSLRNHVLLKHSDVKPYVCSVCGAAFKTRTVLKTHSRIHTDVRKYSCSYCGEGFKWKQTFDKHILKCESSQNNDLGTETESD